MASERLSHEDLRRSGRVNVVSFAWFQVLGEKEGGLARSCDISNRGIGIVTSRPVEAGSRMFIKLAHKGRSVSLLGLVMHSRPEGELFRLGLELEIVPPVDRAALKWMLKP